MSGDCITNDPAVRYTPRGLELSAWDGADGTANQRHSRGNACERSDVENAHDS